MKFEKPERFFWTGLWSEVSRLNFPGFATFDQFVKGDENRIGFLRAWSRCRMVLNAKDRKGFVAQSFDSFVVEIDFGYHGSRFFETLRIDGETVVLRRD